MKRGRAGCLSLRSPAASAAGRDEAIGFRDRAELRAPIRFVAAEGNGTGEGEGEAAEHGEGAEGGRSLGGGATMPEAWRRSAGLQESRSGKCPEPDMKAGGVIRGDRSGGEVDGGALRREAGKRADAGKDAHRAATATGAAVGGKPAEYLVLSGGRCPWAGDRVGVSPVCLNGARLPIRRPAPGQSARISSSVTHGFELRDCRTGDVVRGRSRERGRRRSPRRSRARGSPSR